MNITSKAKESPIVSTLILVIFLSATITGAVKGASELDELVMTHAEHAEDIAAHVSGGMHPAGLSAVEELRLWNICDRLDRKLEAIEERIWRAEDANDSQRVRELEAEQADVLRKYDALDCARVLT